MNRTPAATRAPFVWAAGLLVARALLASPVAAQTVYRYTGKLASFIGPGTTSHEIVTMNCPDPAVQPCIANVKIRNTELEGTIKLYFPAVIPVVNAVEGDIYLTPETPISPRVESDFTFFKQGFSQPTTLTWFLRTEIVD